MEVTCVRLICCYYSTAQACKIWLAAVGACCDCALVAPLSAFLDMVVTFRGRCKGNLVIWWSKVDFSWEAQGIRAVLLRNFRLRGRSTSDTVVIFDAL